MKTKNNRFALQGHCSACNTKMTKVCLIINISLKLYINMSKFAKEDF